MRESMARLTPEFSANRTVREYTEKYYLPAAAVYHQRAGLSGRARAANLRMAQAVAEHWTKLNFGHVHAKLSATSINSACRSISTTWSPTAVLVELYANSQNGGPPVRQPMARADPWSGRSADLSSPRKCRRAGPSTTTRRGLCRRIPASASRWRRWRSCGSDSSLTGPCSGGPFNHQAQKIHGCRHVRRHRPGTRGRPVIELAIDGAQSSSPSGSETNGLSHRTLGTR